MDLKNGYKVLYEVIENDNRVFKASRTNTLADADVIETIAKGAYKLVYEKAGKLYGSLANIPTAGDTELTGFNAVFSEATDETSDITYIPEEPEITEVEDPTAITGDEPGNEPDGEQLAGDENLED